ncbi:MAG: hypothetical protein JXR59_09675 [Desulfuromonadaceae bacterium]|nr:hypothetical protein [Desulfuromonadaceae bacterium]
MKKLVVLIAAAAFIGGISSAAFAGKIEGTVTAVDGDIVSVKVDGKDAKKIDVGAEVDMKVKKSKAKGGADALTGC